MDVSEHGVLKGSVAYFHTCSALAREMFFYPLCTGHYFCDGTYKVERSHYDSFLVIYIAKGCGYWIENERRLDAEEGNLLFLDCYEPHCYGTEEGWEIYWLHFDGVLARRYFEVCTQKKCFLLKGDISLCVRPILKIFEYFDERGKVNEAMLSKRINDLLTEAILVSNQEKNQMRRLGAVEESLVFIAENVERPLTLDELAEHVSLSTFYFARLFKQETGFSPHEYIVRARVDKAKYLLKTTTLPLKEIAYRCGFSNECNFSTSFKKLSGNTPHAYRTQGM